MLVPTFDRLYDITGTIHNLYYSNKFPPSEKFYIIPPVQYTAGIIHVNLCQLKTFYMIPPVLSTARVIHVSFCQLKTVYIIPPVISTAFITHESLCQMKTV